MTDSVTVTLPRSLVDDLRERRPRIHASPDNVLRRLADAVLASLDSAPDAPAADVGDEEMVDNFIEIVERAASLDGPSRPHYDEAARALLTRLATLRERAERGDGRRFVSARDFPFLGACDARKRGLVPRSVPWAFVAPA